MARLIAIDWDRTELRFVVASARSGRLIVHQAGCVLADDPQQGWSSPEQIGARLRQALEGHRLARGELLIVLDRASVELLDLKLPPATDAELPQLVANEVLRESAFAGEEAVVDYVADAGQPGEPRKVIAAVLPSARLQQVNELCAAAGLKPRHVLLRSFAAASLFAHLTAPSQENCLLVNVASEEVDLIVLRAGRLAYWRTARLPRQADPGRLDDVLLAEIRRTVAVAASELAEATVDRICFLAQKDEYSALRHRIEEELGTPAVCLDPFQALGVAEDSIPANRGRLAALLGALLDQAHGRPHAVDFLHPRRPRRQIGRAQLAFIGGAVMLVAVLLVGGLAWHEMRTLDRQNAELAEQLQELTERVNRYGKKYAAAKPIAQWQAREIVWLDELHRLSERFPQSDALVNRLSMSLQPSGGRMVFQGMVRDPVLVVAIEQALRDARHQVTARRIQRGTRTEGEPMHLFDAEILIKPPGDAAGAQQQRKGRP